MTPADTETRKLFAEIRAAAKTPGATNLNHLFGLYQTFIDLRQRGFRPRVVRTLRQARLIIDGGHHAK